MSERHKNQQSEDDDMPTSPAWMTTYGDMMTLLMTFFILIMSFSSIEVEKFKAAMGSLKGAFGILGDSKEVQTDHSWFSPYRVSIPRQSVLQYVENLNELIEKYQLEEIVEIYESDGEVLIRIKNQVLFDLGSAELKPEFIPILSKITKTIVKHAEEIRVAGHTDDLPIHSAKYPSNWELSLDRALNVVRYFVNVEGIHPVKLSAAGYSEYRPLAPNNSAENRARNRRVEILLKW
jgi:chemotaxis protein MotB